MKVLKQYFVNTLIYLPALWVFTGLFLYGRGSKHITILVVLALITIAFQYSFLELKKQLFERKFTWLLLFFSCLALYYKTQGYYSSGALRVLICITIYCIIIPPSYLTKVRESLLQLSIAAGLSSLSFIYYNSVVLHLSRGAWPINAIPYTTFSAAATVSAFYFLLFSDKKNIKILCLIGSILGSYSILLSETRGTLLALIVGLLATFLIYLKRRLSFIKAVALSIIFILALSFISFFAKDSLTTRYNQTVSEYNQIKKGNLNTSIGLRLQMWKAAAIILEKPTLLGLGNTHYQAKEKLVQEGIVSKHIVHFEHYHNQYLTTFVINGAVGLFVILACFYIPIRHYFLMTKKSDLATLGAIIALIYMTASLTDVPLHIGQPLGFYLMFIFIALSETSDPDVIINDEK